MGASRFLPVLALSLAAGSLMGADTPDGEKPKPKGEASATVTVSAEATPVEQAKSPNPVKVLDAEAIRRSGAKNLAELLQQVFPGQVQPYGGPGAATGLYLGGTRAQDVAVLLDGIRITDASNLNPDFSTFGLEGIDRVEVLQGPASTRYGSDTHGGVVALYSAAPAKEGLSSETVLGSGNRGTDFVQLAPAYNWGSGWARLDFRARETDQSTKTANPYREDGLGLSLGQQLGEGLGTLVYRDHFMAAPIPYDASYPPPNYSYQPLYDPYRESSQRNQELIGSYRTAFSDTLSGEFSLGQSLQARLEPAYGGGSQRYHGQRNQAVASLAWTPGAAWRFGFMLDGSQERSAIPNYGGGEDRGSARHLAAALEQSFAFSEQLRLVASERVQKDRIDYTFADGTSIPNRDSSAFVGKLGLNWNPFEHWRAYASYGSSYNTPVLYDLTYNLANGYGDLQNEKSRTLQVGGGYEAGPWSAKLEASRTNYSQVVVFVPLPGFLYRYDNGTDLRVQGVEATLGYRASAWNLEGFLRSQEARNESLPQDQQLKGSGAIGRPFRTAGLRGGVAFGELEATARWTWSGSNYQYFDELGGVDGARTHFNDLALGLTWKAQEGLTWELRGEHLLQPSWTVQQWLDGQRFRQNDAYLIPVFPAQGPTITFAVRYRY